MAFRISATGFVCLVFVLMLTITPDCVVGTRTRIWHEDFEVAGMMMMPSDSTSWRVRLVGQDSGRNSWRKLLFVRRRRPPGEPAARNQPRGQASKSQMLPSSFRTHFVAAFSFFSSMAKGSASPSPATPSPGHN